MRTLRLILGDQLNIRHSWFETVDDDVVYGMFEMHQEATYVRHHIQKITAFFSAMREFAKELEGKGHRVIYQSIHDGAFDKELTDRLTDLIEEENIERFEYLEPDEWRLDRQLCEYCDALEISTACLDTEHFLTARYQLKDFFGEKNYLMESFYRDMRRRYDVLMDGDKPETGKWNYDQENRKKLPDDVDVPEPLIFRRDVTEIVEAIRKEKIDTLGNINTKNYGWPVTRKEGLKLLDHFIDQCLPAFGKYQDAMTPRSWNLFHSRLSFVLNAKLLHPLEVIRRVEKAYHDDRGITIAQTEGFIRQILGWREYMRGIYWARMPEYAELNYFDHQRHLPEFFWSGDTRMACVAHAVNQSLDHAYAHHIQRLMVTGNFALLAGIDPDQVDEWYLGIYIDAIEWVEMTNTRGMSQFADGGIVGTKPYVSSGSYIHKMGSYCRDCQYKVSKKTGDGACPFNSLYWHFIDRNEDKLSGNPRMSMMYNIWNKMSAEKRTDLLEQAGEYLANIEKL